MAKQLSQKGISTTLIPDACVYTIMSRVNKVIIATHGLMANGGLITASGVLGVCEAASAHKVPVIAICGLYKLSPLFPFD
jgi:translation initiation factor eIF-2B subunit beta|mmetsp:Transcript_30952/g.5578  ORF Transcript_30952/g.5578 Transcript_30952/m.5578 type:complete len:80 (-) Transcript_30952:177-416(-)